MVISEPRCCQVSMVLQRPGSVLMPMTHVATQGHTMTRMDKENVVHLHNGVLHHEKKMTSWNLQANEWI